MTSDVCASKPVMMLKPWGQNGEENCAMAREKEGRKAWKANFIHFIILLEAGPIFVSRSGDETL